MTTIHKYSIDNGLRHFHINAPIVKPLKIDYQYNDSPFLWAIVDTDKEPIEWLVTKCGTGWDFGALNACSLTVEAIDPNSYLNTTFESGTPFVWHWFCRPLIRSVDL